MNKLLKNLLTSVTVVAVLLFFIFPAIEPGLAAADNPQNITITQAVTPELSLTVGSATINLAAIAGLTGGTSRGSTYINVVTNNAAGYKIDLTNNNVGRMAGASEGGYILAYTPAAYLVPEAWSVAANTGEFGYSIYADSTEVESGSIWNGLADGSKYYNATDTTITIIKRTSETTIGGASSTINFQTELKANPNPAIPEDTYSSVVTLTASLL